MDCTDKVEAGEALAPHLLNGATVCLGAGRHVGLLDLAISIHLGGEPGAVLDAGGRGPVIRIGEHEHEIVVEDLEITGGAHELGSGVLVEGYSQVTLRGCTVRGNERGQGNGAGLGVRRGFVTVEGCTFGPNDDIVVTTVSEVTFRDTLIEGDVRVLDGAKVNFEGGEIKGRLIVRGTSTRHPVVHLSGTRVAGIDNDETVPGQVVQA